MWPEGVGVRKYKIFQERRNTYRGKNISGKGTNKNMRRGLSDGVQEAHRIWNPPSNEQMARFIAQYGKNGQDNIETQMRPQRTLYTPPNVWKTRALNTSQNTQNSVNPKPPISILKRNGRDTFSTVQTNTECQPEYTYDLMGNHQENLFGPVNNKISGWSNGNVPGNILL